MSSKGDHLSSIAFSVLVLEKTRSAFLVAVVLTTHFMAGFLRPLAMLLSGYLGEKYPIREVLKYSSLLSTVITSAVVFHPHFRRAFCD